MWNDHYNRPIESINVTENGHLHEQQHTCHQPCYPLYFAFTIIIQRQSKSNIFNNLLGFIFI